MQICKCLGTTAPENIITAVCSCRRNITPTKAEFNTVLYGQFRYHKQHCRQKCDFPKWGKNLGRT